MKLNSSPHSCPLKVCSYISIGIIGPLKEIEGFKYFVIVVDYIIKFVEAEPLNEKTGEAVEKLLLHKLLCRYGSCDICITDQ